ncbi:MAG: hypothetical protein ACTSQD_08150 [Promethearchaeota archaeon]
MKLKLILKSKTKKGKEISIKFNIAPSKHIGFINFINLAVNQDAPIELTFEKVSKSGERDESKLVGQFKLQGKDSGTLMQLEKEIQEEEKIKKKQKQRRKQK